MRLLTLLLSLVYFATNCAFAYKPEINFWGERQNRLSLRTPEGGEAISPVFKKGEIASVRAAHVPRNDISQFGTLRKSLIVNRNSPSILHIQDVHLNPEAQTNIAKTIQALIAKGEVDLIALEGASYPINLEPFQQFSDQESVQAVADYLFREKRISGAIYALLADPHPASGHPLPSGRGQGEGSLPIVGIDDDIHYHANINAYKQSRPLVKNAKEKLAKAAQELAAQKSAVFNPALQQLDEAVEKYRGGEIGLGEYLKSLSSSPLVPRSPGQDKGTRRHGDQVDIFIAADQLENSLNFSRVETERALLLNDLLPKLTPAETATLTSLSLTYRLGKMGHAEFYDHLKNLCAAKGVRINRYHTLEKYLTYVALSAQIDAEILFAEIRELEKAAFAALAKTNEERALVAESRRLYLTGKLIDFALTRDEWEEYRYLQSVSPGPLVSRSPGHDDKETWGHGDGEKRFKSFEAFYEEAETRDRLMAENLLAAIKKHNAKKVVLVTGGFHAKGIHDVIARRPQADEATSSFRTRRVQSRQQFNCRTGRHVSSRNPESKRKQCCPDSRSQLTACWDDSVVGSALGHGSFAMTTFVPRITKLDTENGSSYLSVFAQEKTPLEKLFQGEKLFVSPPPAIDNQELFLLTKARHQWAHQWNRLRDTVTLRVKTIVMKMFVDKEGEITRVITVVVLLSWATAWMLVREAVKNPGPHLPLVFVIATLIAVLPPAWLIINHPLNHLLPAWVAMSGQNPGDMSRGIKDEGPDIPMFVIPKSSFMEHPLTWGAHNPEAVEIINNMDNVPPGEWNRQNPKYLSYWFWLVENIYSLPMHKDDRGRHTAQLGLALKNSLPFNSADSANTRLDVLIYVITRLIVIEAQIRSGPHQADTQKTHLGFIAGLQHSLYTKLNGLEGARAQVIDHFSRLSAYHHALLGNTIADVAKLWKKWDQAAAGENLRADKRQQLQYAEHTGQEIKRVHRADKILKRTLTQLVDVLDPSGKSEAVYEAWAYPLDRTVNLLEDKKTSWVLYEFSGVLFGESEDNPQELLNTMADWAKLAAIGGIQKLLIPNIRPLIAPLERGLESGTQSWKVREYLQIFLNSTDTRDLEDYLSLSASKRDDDHLNACLQFWRDLKTSGLQILLYDNNMPVSGSRSVQTFLTEEKHSVAVLSFGLNSDIMKLVEAHKPARILHRKSLDSDSDAIRRLSPLEAILMVVPRVARKALLDDKQTVGVQIHENQPLKSFFRAEQYAELANNWDLLLVTWSDHKGRKRELVEVGGGSTFRQIAGDSRLLAFGNALLATAAIFLLFNEILKNLPSTTLVISSLSFFLFGFYMVNRQILSGLAQKHEEAHLDKAEKLGDAFVTLYRAKPSLVYFVKSFPKILSEEELQKKYELQENGSDLKEMGVRLGISTYGWDAFRVAYAGVHIYIRHILYWGLIPFLLGIILWKLNLPWEFAALFFALAVQFSINAFSLLVIPVFDLIHPRTNGNDFLIMWRSLFRRGKKFDGIFRQVSGAQEAPSPIAKNMPDLIRRLTKAQQATPSDDIFSKSPLQTRHTVRFYRQAGKNTPADLEQLQRRYFGFVGPVPATQTDGAVIPFTGDFYDVQRVEKKDGVTDVDVRRLSEQEVEARFGLVLLKDARQRPYEMEWFTLRDVVGRLSVMPGDFGWLEMNTADGSRDVVDTPRKLFLSVLAGDPITYRKANLQVKGAGTPHFRSIRLVRDPNTGEEETIKESLDAAPNPNVRFRLLDHAQNVLLTDINKFLAYPGVLLNAFYQPDFDAAPGLEDTDQSDREFSHKDKVRDNGVSLPNASFHRLIVRDGANLNLRHEGYGVTTRLAKASSLRLREALHEYDLYGDQSVLANLKYQNRMVDAVQNFLFAIGQNLRGMNKSRLYMFPNGNIRNDTTVDNYAGTVVHVYGQGGNLMEAEQAWRMILNNFALTGDAGDLADLGEYVEGGGTYEFAVKYFLFFMTRVVQEFEKRGLLTPEEARGSNFLEAYLRGVSGEKTLHTKINGAAFPTPDIFELYEEAVDPSTRNFHVRILGDDRLDHLCTYAAAQGELYSHRTDTLSYLRTAIRDGHRLDRQTYLAHVADHLNPTLGKKVFLDAYIEYNDWRIAQEKAGYKPTVEEEVAKIKAALSAQWANYQLPPMVHDAKLSHLRDYFLAMLDALASHSSFVPLEVEPVPFEAIPSAFNAIVNFSHQSHGWAGEPQLTARSIPGSPTNTTFSDTVAHYLLLFNDIDLVRSFWASLVGAMTAYPVPPEEKGTLITSEEGVMFLILSPTRVSSELSAYALPSSFKKHWGFESNVIIDITTNRHYGIEADGPYVGNINNLLLPNNDGKPHLFAIMPRRIYRERHARSTQYRVLLSNTVGTVKTNEALRISLEEIDRLIKQSGSKTKLTQWLGIPMADAYEEPIRWDELLYIIRRHALNPAAQTIANAVYAFIYDEVHKNIQLTGNDLHAHFTHPSLISRLVDRIETNRSSTRLSAFLLWAGEPRVWHETKEERDGLGIECKVAFFDKNMLHASLPIWSGVTIHARLNIDGDGFNLNPDGDRIVQDLEVTGQDEHGNYIIKGFLPRPPGYFWSDKAKLMNMALYVTANRYDPEDTRWLNKPGKNYDVNFKNRTVIAPGAWGIWVKLIDRGWNPTVVFWLAALTEGSLAGGLFFGSDYVGGPGVAALIYATVTLFMHAFTGVIAFDYNTQKWAVLKMHGLRAPPGFWTATIAANFIALTSLFVFFLDPEKIHWAIALAVAISPHVFGNRMIAIANRTFHEPEEAHAPDHTLPRIAIDQQFALRPNSNMTDKRRAILVRDHAVQMAHKLEKLAQQWSSLSEDFRRPIEDILRGNSAEARSKFRGERLDLRRYNLGFDALIVYHFPPEAGYRATFYHIPSKNLFAVMEMNSPERENIIFNKWALIQLLNGNEYEITYVHDVDSAPQGQEFWTMWHHTGAYHTYQNVIHPLTADIVFNILQTNSHPEPVIVDIFGGDGSFLRHLHRSLAHKSPSITPSYHLIEQGAHIGTAIEGSPVTLHQRDLSREKISAVLGAKKATMITSLGGLNHQVTTRQAALEIAQDAFNALENNGVFILTGITLSLVNADDLQRIGFDVRNKMIPSQTDDTARKTLPNQFYIAVKSSSLQSWTGTWGGWKVYGILMPLLEEFIRQYVAQALGLEGIWLVLWYVLIYPLLHAGAHWFVDKSVIASIQIASVAENRSLAMTSYLTSDRYWSRVLHSYVFGVLTLIHPHLGYAAHIINNAILYPLGLTLLMSVTGSQPNPYQKLIDDITAVLAPGRRSRKKNNVKMEVQKKITAKKFADISKASDVETALKNLQLHHEEAVAVFNLIEAYRHSHPELQVIKGQRLMLFTQNVNYAEAVYQVLQGTAHTLIAVVVSPSLIVPTFYGFAANTAIPILGMSEVTSKMGGKKIYGTPEMKQGAEKTAHYLKRLDATVGLAAVFPFVPEAVRTIFNKFLVVHPSFLPDYRGGFTLPALILNGERETGITIFEATDKLDAGPIAKQGNAFAIDLNETYRSLRTKEMEAAAPLIRDVLDDIGRGTYKTTSQQGTPTKHAWGRRLKREKSADGKNVIIRNEGILARLAIDWNTVTTAELIRLTRAFAQPFMFQPFTNHGGHRISIREAQSVPTESTKAPGSVLGEDLRAKRDAAGELPALIKTKDGAVRISHTKTITVDLTDPKPQKIDVGHLKPKGGDSFHTTDRIQDVTGLLYSDAETIEPVEPSGEPGTKLFSVAFLALLPPPYLIVALFLIMTVALVFVIASEAKQSVFARKLLRNYRLLRSPAITTGGLPRNDIATILHGMGNIHIDSIDGSLRESRTDDNHTSIVVIDHELGLDDETIATLLTELQTEEAHHGDKTLFVVNNVSLKQRIVAIAPALAPHIEVEPFTSRLELTTIEQALRRRHWQTATPRFVTSCNVTLDPSGLDENSPLRRALVVMFNRLLQATVATLLQNRALDKVARLLKKMA